ncbi:hypothetical protein B9Z19DRAFT_1067575 [Tuber borchii]|uniref:Uncharacterized protein n=1 Tax=Tuber borchii TaxID=42251 RepID=A0A2T6ZID6_TUBBO|nr:hypothetical protein B9Z19DRAFT_1067575 [Tuber borchii]
MLRCSLWLFRNLPEYTGCPVFHSNKLVVYLTPEKAYDYVGKESVVIVEDIQSESVEGGGSGGSRTQSAALLQCFDTNTSTKKQSPNRQAIEKDLLYLYLVIAFEVGGDLYVLGTMLILMKNQFLEGVRTVAPRLYIGSYHNIQLVANEHSPTEGNMYRSPYAEDSWNLSSEIIDWCNRLLSLYRNNFCKRLPGLRRLALVLYGPTRTGKTECAWSLGNHIFFSGRFKVLRYRDTYEYVVFDDVEFSCLDVVKFWFGNQLEFTSMDKCCKKTKIFHSQPVIGFFNHDSHLASWADSE